MTARRVRLAQARVAAAGVLGCACAWCLAACTPPNRDLQPGTYRAVVDSAGGDLPFGVAVTKNAGGYGLSIVDGEVALPATAVRAGDGKLSAVLPGGRSKLQATIADGTLRGEIALVAVDGRTHPVAFKAILGQDWRFFEQPTTDNFDASGRWAVTFTDERGVEVPGVAEFEQRFEHVTGRVRTADGERRFTGEAHGNELLLSYFDGQSGALWLAKLDKQGALEGELWSVPVAHQRFTATRNPDDSP